MKQFGSLFILWIALLTLPMAVGKAAPSYYDLPSPREKIPTKDFCDIAASPHEYVGKTIRIRATYFINFEHASLFNDRCPGQENVFGVRLDCSDVLGPVCEALRKTLDRNLQGDPFDGMSSEVIVIGHVEALLPKGKINRTKSPSVLFYVKEVEKTKPISKPSAHR